MVWLWKLYRQRFHFSEVLEYGSASMSNIIESKKEFKYELKLGKDKFSQIELDDEGNRIYSENYKRVE